jgi:hypothetical protein
LDDDLAIQIIDCGLEEFILAINGIRDKTMTNGYLDATQPVFGRTELLHALSMQNEILKKLSPPIAGLGFSFFNVFSKPAMDPTIRAHQFYLYPKINYSSWFLANISNRYWLRDYDRNAIFS